MRILVTNDDGIHAPGIAVLEQVAAELTDDVWVSAPAEEQSGAGHSLTLVNPVRVRALGERRFAVRGTPTDSVMMAVGLFMRDHRPDLILSGVNRGLNLAEDVTYSGTVSAAMEGTLAGVRSVALSQETLDGPASTDAFATARAWAPPVIRALLAVDWPPGLLMNVNFPALAPEAVAGIKVTEQGRRDYGRFLIEERVDPRGFPYYWFGLGRESGQPGHETDLKAIREGYVSVTPLHLDLTHRPTIPALRSAMVELANPAPGSPSAVRMAEPTRT
jgi:5'-nucleotidase